MKLLSLMTSAILCFTSISAAQEELVEPMKVVPVVQAIAENDYVQRRPLAQALELGFRNVEADVFLVSNQLRIGSSILDMQSKGTLEDLYLIPLLELHRTQSPFLDNGENPFTLWINLKSDGNQMYRVLRLILPKYAEMLTSVRDNVRKSGAVQIILTGNVPREMVLIENPRYVALDGKYADIDSSLPLHLIPTISLRWSTYFSWQGRNAITASDRARLNSMVERVHQKQRSLRFWSTPDLPNVWTTLRLANVDYIGGEDYVELHQFFTPPASPFPPADSP